MVIPVVVAERVCDGDEDAVDGFALAVAAAAMLAVDVLRAAD